MVPLELYADARKLQMTFEDVFLNKTLIKTTWWIERANIEYYRYSDFFF